MLTLPPNDYFRHFSMTDFLGADLNWKKILEMTETVSDSNVAVSIKGKTTFCWVCELNTIFYNNKTNINDKIYCGTLSILQVYRQWKPVQTSIPL